MDEDIVITIDKDLDKPIYTPQAARKFGVSEERICELWPDECVITVIEEDNDSN